MNHIISIIQARVGSTRFPRKVLKDVAGKPLLWYVIQRVKQARLVDEVIVATTLKKEDDKVVQLASKYNVESFRGSEEDVLDRYYEAAKIHKAEIVVRITGDCPLIDPDIIDEAIKLFLENEFDYVSTVFSQGKRKPTFPDGLDVEVFSFQALEKAWKEARLRSEREHVTPYIWKRPRIFKLGGLECDRDLSSLRWSVDYPEDLEFVRQVYRRLDGEKSRMNDVLVLLETYPEVININKNIVRDEGYIKSLEEDKLH